MGILIKTPEQIEGIRKSCKLAADTLRHIEQFVKPGVTTAEIDRQVEAYMRDHGATPATLGYMGYPKSSCISINEVVCHGIPSENEILKEGDIVNVDVTTILGGYFGDTSRMFAVGEISKDARRIMLVARECLDKAIKKCGPGVAFGEIGKIVTKHARLCGCSTVFQFCGHGCGLNFHEKPQVHHDDFQYDKTRMAAGMTFTIEPMINLGVPQAMICESDGWTARTADGKLSAQYEHMVLITDKGVEILTL